MSDSRLRSLVDTAVISRREYETFMVFQSNDIGRQFLTNMMNSIVMEEPVHMPTGVLFAWHDGRRAVWRDIQMIIDKVNFEMEKTYDN